MTKTSNIFLILLTCISLSACQEDDFGSGAAPDMATLIAQGKYLTARNAETYAAQVDPEKGTWFPDGTPFRLLAFTKPYPMENGNPYPDYDPQNPTAYEYATRIRFNKVTWESKIRTSFGDTVRYINIHGDPDKLFGFSALTKNVNDGTLSDEIGNDTDNLVALDFYGFTYGKAVDKIEDKTENEIGNYITLPNDKPLDQLKFTESVTNGSLNDLMRGQLLNCDIQPETGEAEDIATQSIIPFKHCFSRLQFMVVQEPLDDGTEIKFNTNTTPSFENLYIEGVTVTGTYGSGSVYLKDGKVELPDNKTNRPLKFNPVDPEYDYKVTTQQVYLGDMIIFPSDGNSLKNSDLADGYSLGLEITVRCPDENTLKNFIRNTSEHEPQTNEITTVTINNETYYKCTVKKAKILNSNYNYDDKGNVIINPLYLKQNTNYTLVIAFQKNAVRIITVVPLVEEWLPGETDIKDENGEYWQDQAIGQPQMFDNIVWSDRNLGADHYDPKSEQGKHFEETVGYFYQAGRNIPYYPFIRSNYNGTTPNPSDMNNQNLGDNNSAWGESQYKFYPIVDSKIIRMSSNYEWYMSANTGTPVMEIPEKKPDEGNFFDFMTNVKNEEAATGLKEHNMRWDESKENQPISGSWKIPTSQDYMTIFPSTPFAGNITFRAGDACDNLMDWGLSGSSGTRMNDLTGTDVLRVTVPYYDPDNKTEPTLTEKHNNKYIEAWNYLNNNNDIGTTHTELYSNPDNPDNSNSGPDDNTQYEPNGDPEDGYASVYLISREEPDDKYDIDNIVSLPETYDEKRFTIRSWGTIYAIKRVYTPQAYRMRWRALIGYNGSKNPGLYIEICRYRCTEKNTLTEENYKEYDWDHPAAKIYFPICGLGDYTGAYINFGTECQYATSDPIVNGKTSALQIKITGNNTTNAYIAIVKNQINRHFGMQIRPIVGGVNNTK